MDLSIINTLLFDFFSINNVIDKLINLFLPILAPIFMKLREVTNRRHSRTNSSGTLTIVTILLLVASIAFTGSLTPVSNGVYQMCSV